MFRTCPPMMHRTLRPCRSCSHANSPCIRNFQPIPGASHPGHYRRDWERTLHAEEVSHHSDAVFIGETEGRFNQVIEDFQNGRLKKNVSSRRRFLTLGLVGPRGATLLDRRTLHTTGVSDAELRSSSRGCKLQRFPCCVGLSRAGREVPASARFDKVIEEMASIPNKQALPRRQIHWPRNENGSSISSVPWPLSRRSG